VLLISNRSNKLSDDDKTKYFPKESARWVKAHTNTLEKGTVTENPEETAPALVRRAKGALLPKQSVMLGL
jgi:hypothetical protein